MRTRTLRTLLAIVAVAALAATAGCTTSTTVNATNGPAPDTVTALGVGTGTASPDKATVSFGVNAKAKTGPAAMESCSKATTRIVDTLKKAGIEEKEIQTEQISLYPTIGVRGRVSGYQASQSISVTTKKIAKLSDVIAAATAVGASTVNGPRFFMSSENVARADAIAKAMTDAKSRATAMAKASGRTLGGVLSVAEQPQSSAGYPGYGADVLYASAAKAMVAPPVLPGQQEQQASISVVFSLR